jgi:hypothetical protein
MQQRNEQGVSTARGGAWCRALQDSLLLLASTADQVHTHTATSNERALHWLGLRACAAETSAVLCGAAVRCVLTAAVPARSRAVKSVAIPQLITGMHQHTAQQLLPTESAAMARLLFQFV